MAVWFSKLKKVKLSLILTGQVVDGRNHIHEAHKLACRLVACGDNH